jgi:hypothetical protein
MIACCITVRDETIKRFDHKWLYYIILSIPIVNVIMSMLLLDMVIMAYKRSYREKKDEVIQREETIRTLKREYEDLERKKFRKVRLGDKFRVPNTDSWVDKFRGSECRIVEIDGDYIIAKSKGDDVSRWSVKWEHLGRMVFLSDEPIKPFEFVKK